jgi:hypothetical protein
MPSRPPALRRASWLTPLANSSFAAGCRASAHLLDRALDEAHERNQNFIDDHTMEAAIDQSPVGQVVRA